ncbi:NADP-dependent oxidoreductase domain-containing protein [Lipomyces arxii]|uniref:NADP-dependent oxidoreductase domain-containing protein n=1 Tax=Lipomyces arxii TaxID=56418 RepID=UPI0034CFD351
MVAKLVSGTVIFGDPKRLPLASQAQEFLDILKEHGVNHLDTAYVYPGGDTPTLSEKIIGELGAEKQGFTIDTKVRSFIPGAHAYDKIIASAKAQLEHLKIKQINTLYLHAPDRSIPFDETHKAMNELYKEGVFKNFGLSNYTADEVQIFLDNAEKNGWVKPTVYQGLYNLVSRLPEEHLFPLLRKNGIAFYAFTPLAGGFFSNIKKGQSPDANGRFDINATFGGLYQNMFYKDAIFEASAALNDLAEKHGLTSNAVALRWIRYHSGLSDNENNAVILGGSNKNQLLENVLNATAGPLPDDVVAGVDRLWEIVKSQAPTYHF